MSSSSQPVPPPLPRQFQPRSWVRGVSLLLALLVSGLLTPALAQGTGKADFRVEMVSPQRFRIEPRISGPVAAAMVGGGNQTLITRQENGRTIIDAVVPVGAVLRLQVGPRSLGLKMVDSQHYQYWEE
jgi:hypothetical protein